MDTSILLIEKFHRRKLIAETKIPKYTMIIHETGCNAKIICGSSIKKAAGANKIVPKK